MVFKHEMIHAYLFLTNAKDPDGHGPEFLRMASYINKMEKTNIQQYHNFKAEVEFYSQQWKCNKCSATTKGTPKKCACKRQHSLRYTHNLIPFFCLGGGAFVKVPNGSGAKSSTASTCWVRCNCVRIHNRFIPFRAWSGEVDDDGQVCGNQKESGTSNRPATSQETTSFLA